jgi:hypothetical protein
MPQLEFPIDPETGRAPRSNGSGSSGGTNSRQSRTEINLKLSIGELIAHLNQQLSAQGWTADANWQGTTTAGSSWYMQLEEEPGVQGTLDITATSDSRYTVMFRVAVL